jgi:Coenzyme PQQ synthesis protein D (PqqD)
MDTTLFRAASGNYPRRRSDINARIVVDETVVLDLGAAQIHQLNATASFIWHRCDGRRTVVEIAEELAGSFGVDYAPARQAVEATLRRLAELGLLDSARAA